MTFWTWGYLLPSKIARFRYSNVMFFPSFFLYAEAMCSEKMRNLWPIIKGFGHSIISELGRVGTESPCIKKSPKPFFFHPPLSSIVQSLRGFPFPGHNQEYIRSVTGYGKTNIEHLIYYDVWFCIIFSETTFISSFAFITFTSVHLSFGRKLTLRMSNIKIYKLNARRRIVYWL